ncbi:MAG: hypothetical protein C3F15_09830 [Holophagae bacterium]|nr:MAG: hypothetical protein C3F15_09830 [Holophagae bacterium]
MKRCAVTILLVGLVALSAASEEVRTLKLSPGFVSKIQAAQQQRDQAVSRGGQGPAAVALPLADLVTISQLNRFEGVGYGDLCRLSTNVYPDVNADSGIYYYYPARWYLHFEPEEGGYHLRIEYKASSTGANSVLLTAQLTPGYDQHDLAVLQALLDEYLRSQGNQRVRPKLLPLPATPEARFQLASWDIEEVTVNAIEPDTNTIHLSITADVPTKELVTSTLLHEGLPGSVTLVPDVWSDLQTLTSPVEGYAEIRLADITGGPTLRWPTTTSGGQAELVNEWPFDMRLSYLVYLLRDRDGGLRLRGWGLGDRVLGPKDTARIPLSALNREFGSDSAVDARFVATLVRSEDVGRSVIDACTGGVGALPVENLVIDIMQPEALFEQYSIYRVAVEVRSAHFDPEGRQVVTRSYVLDGAETPFTADPLYLWEDQAGGDLYQYRVGVVTNDGVTHADESWRRPGSFLPYTINIGSDVVEAVLAE